MRTRVYAVFAAVVRALFGTCLARLLWRLPGARRLYERLARMRPDVVTVDGHTIRLDATDSLLLAVNGAYEPGELALFEGCIRPGDTVLDIGAHIGLYTLAAARAVGPSGQVVAFEPSVENHALLAENVAANGYTNVELHQTAVSDHAGSAVLVLSATNSGDHQLRDRGHGDLVETVRLDDIDVAPQVVKMDVQGAEPLVLAGAQRLLAAPDLLLFTEVSPHHLGHDAVAYVASLRDAGFTLLHVDEETGQLEPFDTLPDTGFVNLVCVKGQATERIRRAGSESTP